MIFKMFSSLNKKIKMSKNTNKIPIDDEPCIVDLGPKFFEEENEDEVVMQMLPEKEAETEEEEKKVELKPLYNITQYPPQLSRSLTPPTNNKHGLFGVYVVFVDGEVDCCLDSLMETERYIRNKAMELKKSLSLDPYYSLYITNRRGGIDIERNYNCFLVSYDTVVHRIRYVFARKHNPMKALCNV